MTHRLKKEKNYSYIEAGEGTPIIVLHGLMGGLSNFDAVTDFLAKRDTKYLSLSFLFTRCPYLKLT